MYIYLTRSACSQPEGHGACNCMTYLWGTKHVQQVLVLDGADDNPARAQRTTMGWSYPRSTRTSGTSSCPGSRWHPSRSQHLRCARLLLGSATCSACFSSQNSPDTRHPAAQQWHKTCLVLQAKTVDASDAVTPTFPSEDASSQVITCSPPATASGQSSCSAHIWGHRATAEASEVTKQLFMHASKPVLLLSTHGMTRPAVAWRCCRS